MNLALKDIVKEELQKLLDTGFIYPISDSEWVSPLVLVPKKNGKIVFSFLDGFSGYNQIQICSEDQDKTTFTCPWGTFAYNVLLFGLCNSPATFERAVLSIFAKLVHDVVEIYMDDFAPYGCDFQEALSNLRKVLQKCIKMNLSLNPEKIEFLMTVGAMLGHSISQQGLEVDPNKITIIQRIPPPQKQRDFRSFLGLARYYRSFIKDFSKLASPLFGLLAKYSEFIWSKSYQEALDILKDMLTTAPII
eukprot:PITA_01611